MILLDGKSKNSSSSPLSLVTPKSEKGISFSDLLKGVSEKKDAKGVQNGSLILSLGSEAKNVKPLQVDLKAERSINLKGSDDLTLLQDDEELSALNPKLLSSLTKEEMKALSIEAKNYLKDQIQNSDGYKKAQIKELPKTLSGLVEVAKKFDIDISKISFEELKGTLKDNTNLKEVRSEIVKEISSAKGQASQKEPTQETLTKEAVSQANENSKKEAHKEVRQEMPKEALKEVLTQTKETTTSIKNTDSQEKDAQRAAANAQASQEISKDEKFTQVQKEIKETPLFKAQTPQQHATTEQIVQVKANTVHNKTEEKTPKTKADETLKLLLREEKPSLNTMALTADFSVATAKVIAPNPTQDGVKTLEQLLNRDFASFEQNTSSAKTESLTTHKADSFEVKLNEAKQMIKYLSNDVKNAIDDYKSPFTRVKIQLNPAHLGEVDLTVVQRGKNLHVNISSNNVAVNTLAMNANELRVQLNNSGINNATLNFSDGGQSGDTNAGGQHQQRQNEQRAHEEYSYFENEEMHEETLSSLEIVVPRYI
ncbi:flagellar hook-length control protein FliK [Sulfurimonas crateris]|uniref:Flagellar hook-length control protein FliK n=1 Tax=Sulfurimonas crateris TaxID=2574727 RepID=A0A4U2Z9S2_9BACT|nr:flagellar hook-length control protein FliK [Sulfurimonas crateris]TKI70884.1 flagellar hook-length control protein FliK [Sulfurimonas crateris]